MEGDGIIQIIKDLSQEFFHTTSKRMKISSESSQFLEALADLIVEFPETEEVVDIEDV